MKKTEFRSIPYFRNYTISEKGEVRRLNKTVKCTNDRVMLVNDRGLRTTRKPSLLVKLVWGAK